MNFLQHHRDLPLLGVSFGPVVLGLLVGCIACFFCSRTLAAIPDGAPAAAAPAAGTAPQSTPPEQRRFYIQEIRVKGGGHLIPQTDVETAVYPYLGPYRTATDVEQARRALEQAFREKGYQTVTVTIPPQSTKGGIIYLQVMKGEVERLRVHGSRYFAIDQIEREAPSLQEGQSPNFSQVTHDLGVLNQTPDRQVTPTVTPGTTPGTVDINLDVKDTLPLHGSLEVNNRYSAGTTPLRVNGSVSYDNLWQLEHSIGFSFQVAPENPYEVKVFSGYYTAHVPDYDWLTLTLQGTDQQSNVNTLGGIGVAGNGQVVGGRAGIKLPVMKDFYQSLSLGLDYKHFTQEVNTFGSSTLTPVTYFPASLAYSGDWFGKGYETDMNASVNLAIRGTGSDEDDFELNRHGASGDFFYFRGDLSHQRDLPEGFQIFGKIQGQASDQPLVNSEQFSAGGLGTVRGLLESEVLGDNGALGTIEFRSPSLSTFLGKTVDEWRFYIFGDGGVLTVQDPLPETPYQYNLLSVGAGTRIKLLDHLNGSLDVGIPIIVDSLFASVPPNTYLQNPISERPYDARLTFRVWADF